MSCMFFYSPKYVLRLDVLWTVEWLTTIMCLLLAQSISSFTERCSLSNTHHHHVPFPGEDWRQWPSNCLLFLFRIASLPTWVQPFLCSPSIYNLQSTTYSLQSTVYIIVDLFIFQRCPLVWFSLLHNAAWYEQSISPVLLSLFFVTVSVQLVLLFFPSPWKSAFFFIPTFKHIVLF